MIKHGTKAVAALLLAAGGITAGCASDDANGSDPDAIRIGVAFYTKTIPLYAQMEEGMKAKAKEMGASIEFAYADNSAETQSNQINTFVTKGVDVILASPIDVDALVPAYQQARAADIPVISVGNKVADDEEDAFVGPDLSELAEETMQATIDAIGGSGEILLLTGPPQIAFVQLQQVGWDAVLAKNPDVTIADTLVVPDMTTGAAADVAASGLAANPDVDAVISSLDDVSLGAIEAAKTAKLDLADVFFAGWDGGPAALDAIRSGDYDLTLSFRAKTWGATAIETAVDYANGKKPEGHYVDTPHVLIDQANIETLSEADRS
jgi:ABC-type sugar transport system substrate-binding protein